MPATENKKKRVREEQLVFLNRGQETYWHAPFIIKIYQKFYTVKT